MGIKIGDKNKIKNSIISNNSVILRNGDKKSWLERHPVICGVIVSVTAGTILMFSFWTDVITAIEKLFGG